MAMQKQGFSTELLEIVEPEGATLTRNSIEVRSRIWMFLIVTASEQLVATIAASDPVLTLCHRTYWGKIDFPSAARRPVYSVLEN